MFPDKPAEAYYIGTFDSRHAYIGDLDNDPAHNDYGGRLTAWFKAPTSGDYRFFVQSDDQSQLFLSTDQYPSNKVMLLQNECCNGGWEDGRSAVASNLVAGQMYYMELLYKEGGGGDYGRVAVRLPGETTALADLMPIGPQYLWTMLDPDAITTVPTTGMLAVGALNVRGFSAHLVQVTNNFTNDTIALTESVLAGTYPDQGPNLAGWPYFAVPGAINFNVEANSYGRLRPDMPFLGIPGASNSTERFVAEYTAHVQLTPGLHAFAVNSDDNFRVYIGGANVGEFNFLTGRGTSDTVFRFLVPEEGLYPIRVVFCQGTGGGNVELWAADATSQTIVPVNGSLYPTYRVADIVPPVITCPQALTAECGVPVNYGVSAADVQDGPVVVSCTPTNGSALAVGTTAVTCVAADAFGNSANCSFDVVVTDTKAPLIACPANVSVFECAGPNGRAVTLPVSATDACQGAVPVVCVPASGSVFPLGQTTVNCTATDTFQNTTNCTFTVDVREGDTTAPVVVCPPAPATAECAGPNGTVVQYGAATAADNCDATVAVTCVPPSGSTFVVGPTTVTCSSTDAANNTGTCSFVVTVADTTAPQFVECGPDIVTCNPVVTYSPTAIDICGTANVVCTPASGSTFTVGETTVNCTATDAANNTAQCSFKVTVAPVPNLTINRQGADLIVTWTTPSCNCDLYFATTLNNSGNNMDKTNWQIFSGTVTVNGGTSSVTLPAAGAAQFFQLKVR